MWTWNRWIGFKAWKFCGILISRFDQNSITCDILISRWCWKLNFSCTWVSSTSEILEKTGKCKLKKNFASFYTADSQKYSKHQKNFFMVQKYRNLHHLSLQFDLKIPGLASLFHQFFLFCQEALHNKIVIDYNRIVKPNDFRHLCNNVWSREVCLLCFVKFVTLVLYRCWKKSNIKE